jgi:hypothetical protein
VRNEVKRVTLEDAKRNLIDSGFKVMENNYENYRGLVFIAVIVFIAFRKFQKASKGKDCCK